MPFDRTFQSALPQAKLDGQPSGAPLEPTAFREAGALMVTELVRDLEQEHVREVTALQEERRMLRTELERVLQLMTTVLLPREKSLHEQLAKLNLAYEEATVHLHENLTGMSRQAPLWELRQIERQHAEVSVDPLRDCEEELSRIRELLQRYPGSPGPATRQLDPGISGFGGTGDRGDSGGSLLPAALPRYAGEWGVAPKIPPAYVEPQRLGRGIGDGASCAFRHDTPRFEPSTFAAAAAAGRHTAPSAAATSPTGFPGLPAPSLHSGLTSMVGNMRQDALRLDLFRPTLGL